MTAGRSPHQVLGLAPGASRAAIEAAYRRLIKQHHPDVRGGSAEAAQAIIAAYRHLCRTPDRPAVQIETPPAIQNVRRPWRRWLAFAAVAAVLWSMPWTRLAGWRAQEAVAVQAPLPVVSAVRPSAPLHAAWLPARVAPDVAAVEAGIGEARRLDRQSGGRVIEYSWSCFADLVRLPGSGLLDHCLAFDLAAAHGSSGTRAWLSAETMAKRHAQSTQQLLRDDVLAKARIEDVRRLVERRLLEEGPALP